MRWGIHFCDLDETCRQNGASHRVSLFTPWGSLIIGLTPDSWTQAWLPVYGYQEFWSPVVWHPADKED